MARHGNSRVVIKKKGTGRVLWRDDGGRVAGPSSLSLSCVEILPQALPPSEEGVIQTQSQPRRP